MFVSAIDLRLTLFENQLPESSLILYQAEDGRTHIQCRFEGETLWLSQALMAELFQVTVPRVNEHLKGIYAEGELAEAATIRKFRIVRIEGRREVAHEIEHAASSVFICVMAMPLSVASCSGRSAF